MKGREEVPRMQAEEGKEKEREEWKKRQENRKIESETIIKGKE